MSLNLKIDKQKYYFEKVKSLILKKQLKLDYAQPQEIFEIKV